MKECTRVAAALDERASDCSKLMELIEAVATKVI